MSAKVIKGPQTWFMTESPADSAFKRMMGERLALVRIIRDQDGADWAEAIGTTPSSLSAWENGTYFPAHPALARAADLFGFSLDWIYRGDASGLRVDLAREVRRRRPDLVLGAPPDATPSDDWDYRPGAIPRWRRRRRPAA